MFSYFNWFLSPHSYAGVVFLTKQLCFCELKSQIVTYGLDRKVRIGFTLYGRNSEFTFILDESLNSSTVRILSDETWFRSIWWPYIRSCKPEASYEGKCTLKASKSTWGAECSLAFVRCCTFLVLCFVHTYLWHCTYLSRSHFIRRSEVSDLWLHCVTCSSTPSLSLKHTRNRLGN